MYGQICASMCLMQRSAKQSKSGLSKKPKLDNARQLRSIFFIEPDDEEFTHTMKNARRKLEISMPAAMPCKTPVNCRGETCCSIGKHKTKCACIVDADESVRIRLKWVRGSHRCKRNKFAKPLQFGTQVFLMPQAFKIPDAKAAVEK